MILRGSLFAKYAIPLVVLVSGALVVSGLTQIYFSYQESKSALARIQYEKAAAAAIRIEQFARELEHDLSWIAQTPWGAHDDPLDQRRLDSLRLLRQAPAITEVSHIDPTGHEQLRVSRLAMDVVGSNADFSGDSKFTDAMARRIYFSPIYFRKESEPYMTIAMTGATEDTGVVVAEANLKFIWDVVSNLKVGKDGNAYVVDERGRLIAHPDISMVLQKTDLSTLPQVEDTLANPNRDTGEFVEAMVGRDVHGTDVLSARATITPLNWTVFVDLPIAEAFAPLYASILRTLILVLAGVLVSTAASLYLVRRMVSPIQVLRAGAARIGAGALDHRIEVRSGDELQALADEFNGMTERLQESYAGLERKVDERTREIEQKNHELEIASQHKSEFLANMSHELRTPLNAIIGFSEVLKDGLFGTMSPKQDEYIRDIHGSGHHLLSLINDILDLSKVEAGRMELSPSSFDVPAAIDDALTLVRERATRHGIKLSTQIDGDIDVFTGDERMVKQILLNLLSNAIKFTPEGGDVTVRAAPTENGVQISVSDTGIGISQEEHQSIFDAFQQGDGGRDPAREGTGLGLTLARRFIELHMGKIWVESKMSVGSTFSFTLVSQS